MAASNTQDSDKAKVRQFSFVALCHITRDELMHVVFLSKHCQRQHLDFSAVQPMVKGTREALGEMIVHPFPAEEDFLSSLHGNMFKESKLFDLSTPKPAFDYMKT